jgi:hypothetical protein
MLDSTAPSPVSKRHDLLRIWVLVDTAVEVLHSLHADHDDQPGRRAASGFCSGRAVVSMTATIKQWGKNYEDSFLCFHNIEF